MRIHLIGVCGTGMGSLAGLLKEAGHQVSGSDRAFEPPMGDALARWGIELKQGYSALNLEPAPDYVVVGNVCRSDNVEARAAIDGGFSHGSMAKTVHDFFLADRVPFVVAGTHGKTTTTALLAFLLDRCMADTGFLVGGLPKDFTHSFRAGSTGKPFVIEGDEYDSAFFEKYAKFMHYAPHCAVINAIEHDHIDIYPDMQAYRAAFVKFAKLVPEEGLLLANAADAEVCQVVGQAKCRVRYFATDSDQVSGRALDYSARVDDGGRVVFTVLGTEHGPIHLPMTGQHNLRNAVAALALAHEGAGVPVAKLLGVLPGFGGIARRQELRGEVRGVAVYDDFAHHPTAVVETLSGLRKRHPSGRLIAVFEPRSATASRGLHQTRYPSAFEPADWVLIAPVGRPEIPQAERLDVERIAGDIKRAGGRAQACKSVEQIVALLAAESRGGDVIVVMSNGAFGGIHERLLQALKNSP